MKFYLICLVIAMPLYTEGQIGIIPTGMTGHVHGASHGAASKPILTDNTLLRDNSSGSIRFPNAFRWNHNGPTGGYWEEGLPEDFIFRPEFTNVAEYKLQIFNRAGRLIYESNDVKKGWDGYLKNGVLSVQGVYIWMATGKFTDGSVFNKTGDVTFLH
jgi:hypothetical protein